jgi:2-iminobutanoate/2-iminopropanoate deaminase
MKQIVIETDQAPAAIGPYTQALAAGPFVFISGQIPLDPNGRLVEGDIVVQTVQVLANLKAILAAVGLGPKDVVKTTVYLTDLADFQEMNRTYGEFFPQDPPARTTVQVAGLPRNVSVEIEAGVAGLSPLTLILPPGGRGDKRHELLANGIKEKGSLRPAARGTP